MKNTDAKIEVAATPEGLAKRMFVLTMIGVVAYIGVVIMLLTTVD